MTCRMYHLAEKPMQDSGNLIGAMLQRYATAIRFLEGHKDSLLQQRQDSLTLASDYAILLRSGHLQNERRDCRRQLRSRSGTYLRLPA